MSIEEMKNNQFSTPAYPPGKNGPLKNMARDSKRVGKPPRPQLNVQVVVGPRERRIQSHYNQSQQGINNGSETKTADSRSLMNDQLEDVRDKSDMQSWQSPNCTKQHDNFNEQLPPKMNATSVKKNSNKLNNSLLTPFE